MVGGLLAKIMIILSFQLGQINYQKSYIWTSHIPDEYKNKI